MAGADELLAIMEWEKQELQQQQLNGGGGDGGGLYVKVMTDEQMELLRRQISAYATICEQLVEMHKAITAQQDLAGSSLSLSLEQLNSINLRGGWFCG